MAVLPLVIAPDPRLKARSRRVERVDAAVRRLMDDMLETMYAEAGIGLAAIQVGVRKRIIVADVAEEGEARAPLRLANPEIVWASPETVVMEEGCLSFPEQFAEVERPERVRVRYLDENGELREREVEGRLARCLQHEIDHLEGVLFVDYLSLVRRNIILRKLVKAKRTGAVAGARA